MESFYILMGFNVNNQYFWATYDRIVFWFYNWVCVSRK